jgi:hypothetical protein
LVPLFTCTSLYINKYSGHRRYLVGSDEFREFLLDAYETASMGVAQGASELVDTGGIDVTDETVTVDGNRLHYLTGGSGDTPLILLHGGIIDAAHISWGELLGPFTEQTRVYALNLPGYGGSELPDGPLSMASHVEAVAGFIDTLDIEDPVIAGTSIPTACHRSSRSRRSHSAANSPTDC